MVIETVNGSVGDPVIKQIDQIVLAVAGMSPEETLQALDRYGIQWHVSQGGTLLARSWQVIEEGFVSPEQAREIRTGREMPREVDNLDWLSAHLGELRRLYPGKWVAIVEGKIIASAPTLPELVVAAETAGAASPLVTFIAEQEPTWDIAYGYQDL